MKTIMLLSLYKIGYITQPSLVILQNGLRHLILQVILHLMIRYSCFTSLWLLNIVMVTNIG